MNKQDLINRVKELEKENEELHKQFVIGKAYDLKESASSFVHNGNKVRISLDEHNNINVNSDDKTMMIEPYSNTTFKLHFKD